MSRTFASLGYFNYRLWFAGALVSNVGTWMQRVAQDWLVLTVLSEDSGIAVGTVTALQFLPFLLLGPFAGVLVDRVDQRKAPHRHAGRGGHARHRPWRHRAGRSRAVVARVSVRVRARGGLGGRCARASDFRRGARSSRGPVQRGRP
ncbi:hypothetical protein GCM10025876_20790 [Demequina litorisediminis]|uniref:MFS transporter n=1 Tax=Demequina litorisediminis TaxID=1849022 RepID=A0ABQ6IDI1_9MICO|nr:hypothetical protein GCM10025876_20790 [Demequina litorisediminis]